MDTFELRAVIKYFCKKGLSMKEIHGDVIITLGDKSPLYSIVKKWAAEFRRGRESMENYEWSGCPKEATTDVNVELVHSWIMCDRTRSMHDISKTYKYKSWGSVQSILTNSLGMSKVSARWIPKMLTKAQNKSRLDISKYLLSLYEDDPEELMH